MKAHERNSLDAAVELLRGCVSDLDEAGDLIERLQGRVADLEIELGDANRRIEELEQQLAEVQS